MNSEHSVESSSVPAAACPTAMVPSGWRFVASDFSLNAMDGTLNGYITLKRDLDGMRWWLSLSGEEKETVALYVTGAGRTFSEALLRASERATAEHKASGSDSNGGTPA